MGMSHAARKSKLELKLWLMRITYVIAVAIVPAIMALAIDIQHYWATLLLAANPIVALMAPCSDKTFGTGKRFYWVRQSILTTSIILIAIGGLI